jgi:hypothetical protein
VRAVEPEIRQDDRLDRLKPDRLADDRLLDSGGHQPASQHTHADDDHHHAGENKDPVNKDVDEIVPPPLAEQVLLFMQRQQTLERDKDQAYQEPSTEIEEPQQGVEKRHHGPPLCILDEWYGVRGRVGVRFRAGHCQPNRPPSRLRS